MKQQYFLKLFKSILLFPSFILFFMDGYSQNCAGNQVTMSIQNITATDNTLEFDLYLENTGTTNLLLAGCQGNVRYSEGLLSGNQGDFTVVTHPYQTGNFPTLNGITGITNTAATRQLRWISTPTPGLGASLPAHVPMKYARFRFTGATPWATNAPFAITFAPEEDVQPGITTNVVLVYCNDNPVSSVIYGTDGGILFRNSETFLISNLLSTTAIDQSTTVTAFPNPFADTFKLNMKLTEENVAVKVYDMIGKLIDTKAVKASDMAKQEFGNNYKSGIYNIVVTQGSNQQTLRMVKK